jgi:hypothetical protein
MAAAGDRGITQQSLGELLRALTVGQLLAFGSALVTITSGAFAFGYNNGVRLGLIRAGV